MCLFSIYYIISCINTIVYWIYCQLSMHIWALDCEKNLYGSSIFLNKSDSAKWQRGGHMLGPTRGSFSLCFNFPGLRTHQNEGNESSYKKYWEGLSINERGRMKLTIKHYLEAKVLWNLKFKIKPNKIYDFNYPRRKKGEKGIKNLQLYMHMPLQE